MSFKVKFTESDQTFKSRFGEVIQLDPPVILAKEITANGVYNASEDDASGYNPVTVNVDMSEAFNEGKKAEYDAFWDSVQNYGERENYQYTFAGFGWNDTTFKPKYDIKPTNPNNMFMYSRITNLKAILESQGVKLDFSKCSALTYTFQHSAITHLGEIDTRSCENLQYTFNNTKSLKWVDKLILKNDGSQTFSSSLSFAQSENLEHIIFEGVVGVNGLNMKQSTKLDKESLTSIINVLSTTTTGLTVTLSKTAVNNAFTDAEWEALRNTKSNWTISLI